MFSTKGDRDAAFERMHQRREQAEKARLDLADRIRREREAAQAHRCRGARILPLQGIGQAEQATLGAGYLVGGPCAPAACVDEPLPPTTLGFDSQERKEVPLFRGLLRYFPAALAAVARVSKHGNDKHNPGQEMHHARGKSSDHADCLLRHLVDLGENDGYDENGLPQVGYIAWRALALAQEWLETHENAPLAPGAKKETS